MDKIWTSLCDREKERDIEKGKTNWEKVWVIKDDIIKSCVLYYNVTTNKS